MAALSFGTSADNNPNKPVSADWLNDLNDRMERGLAVIPHDFGSVAADGATDDSAAFVAALDYLRSVRLSGFGYSHGSPRLYIPAGNYYLGTTTLDLTSTLILEGDNTGDATGGATVLSWAANTTGIRVQAGNTTGASGTKVSDGSRGSASIIRNLMLIGANSGDADYHGIHLRGNATIRDCYIEGFAGDGIYSSVTAGSGGATEGNANNIYVERVYIENCRTGLYLDGADVNAGTFIGVNVKNPRAWGIWDSSFLANTHIGHHVSGAVSGAYKSDNVNARTLFLGCYSESGQPESSFVWPTTVIGGVHAAGITGDALLLGDAAAAGDLAAIRSDQNAYLGQTLLQFDTGTGSVLELWNNSANAAGNQAKIKFSQGLEVDGTTPEGLATIYAKGLSANPALNEALIVFSTRTFGGTGAMTDRIQLNGASLAFEPVNDNNMELGLTGTRWKKLWAYSGEFTNQVSINGTKVIGAQGAAVADATDAASAITQLNAALARLRAHGLIAT